MQSFATPETLQQHFEVAHNEDVSGTPQQNLQKPSPAKNVQLSPQRKRNSSRSQEQQNTEVKTTVTFCQKVNKLYFQTYLHLAYCSK